VDTSEASEDSLADGSTGGSADDCLLLRLATVRALLRCKRDEDGKPMTTNMATVTAAIKEMD